MHENPRLYKYRDSYVLYKPTVHAFGSVLLPHTFFVTDTHTWRVNNADWRIHNSDFYRVDNKHMTDPWLDQAQMDSAYRCVDFDQTCKKIKRDQNKYSFLTYRVLYPKASKFFQFFLPMIQPCNFLQKAYTTYMIWQILSSLK